MAYTASQIIGTIGEMLQDPGKDVWGLDLICKKVTEAQNLIVSLRPDAGATNATFSLALAARQTIPTGGFKLLDVIMNTGGAPVQQIERDRLTRLVPGWTTETGTAVEFYMVDDENPETFWVYPTPSGAASLEIVYAKIPDAFTTGSTGLGIKDIYIAQVYEWVLFRCLSIESSGQDLAKAAAHLSTFTTLMGIKKTNDILLRQIQQADK